MPSTFKAQVQYQDWEGTAAADEHQGHEFEDFLESKQLMGQHETLISVSLGVIEGHVYVHAHIVDRGNFDSAKALVEQEDPIPTRRVDLNIDGAGVFLALQALRRGAHLEQVRPNWQGVRGVELTPPLAVNRDAEQKAASVRIRAERRTGDKCPFSVTAAEARLFDLRPSAPICS